MEPEEVDLVSGVLKFHGRIGSMPIQAAQCSYNEAQDANYYNLFLRDGTGLGEAEEITYNPDGTATIHALLIWNRSFAVRVKGTLTVAKDAKRTSTLKTEFLDGQGNAYRTVIATGVYGTLIPG